MPTIERNFIKNPLLLNNAAHFCAAELYYGNTLI